MKNIIFLAVQGAGKGTFAKLLKSKYNYAHISTGDIFRKNISENTPLGIEADKYISKGNLEPDEITVPMAEILLFLLNANHIVRDIIISIIILE